MRACGIACIVAAIAAVVRLPAPAATTPTRSTGRLPVALHRAAPAEQLVVVVLHAPSEGQQLASEAGELDLARAAIEELDVELLLEPADLLTQRGGRDAQPFRGATEVQLLGEHAEIADHVDRHIHARILACD